MADAASSADEVVPTMRYLGLDLGGTNIKVAVIEARDTGQTPTLIHTATGPTDAEGGPQSVADRLVDLGREAIEAAGLVDGAGVGVPGLFDFQSGEIVFFTNLPGAWEGFPLRRRVAEGLGVATTLINDARAFTLAEGTMGAGRGCRTLVCITLGTGIGGGVMIDGRIHFGAFGTGGEIGHQTVAPGGQVCGCGNPGCLEAVARPPMIADMAGKASIEEVLDGLEKGDIRCIEAVARAAEYLGIGLANIMTVLGPDRIVIGGGVAAAGDLLLGPIREAVKARVTLIPPERVEIAAAELGSVAGAIGAALAARTSPLDDTEFLAGEIPSATIRREELGC